MADTEILASVERAYRDAVSATPYSSISVKHLCEEAGVTRKAFYKRFDGKSDVLRRVFERDVVQPAVELCRLLSFGRMSRLAPEMERHMLQAVLDDGAFYRDVVAAPQGGREAFMRVASASFHDFNQLMLGEYGYSGEPWQVECVSAYFANAKASFLVGWIEGGYCVPVGELGRLYVEMALPFWSSLSK